MSTSPIQVADEQRILVVDDEPTICWAFEKLFQGEGHRVLVASSAEEGLDLAKKHAPDLILLDVRLPEEDGISALPKFLTASGEAPVIVMTAFGDLETAVSAVQSGATDYVTKPFELDEVSLICRKALEAGRGRRELETRGVLEQSSKLVGVSPAMQTVFKQIAFMAASDLPILITGETGTGKELVAEAVHRHSHRKDLPYVCLAPVTLNEDLIESELFGHVEGAFTGAHQDRAGIFEYAAGGTVLLDEIGELPISLQVKLLRVLETGQYSRVGESKTNTCDVRIIAATNRDLHQAVQEGVFREDLFYRLNGLQMHLPPLRQRVEDLGPLCQHFLSQMSYPVSELSEELLAGLDQRPWPGNVRQLRSAIQQAAVVARGQPLSLLHFPPVEVANHPSQSDSLSSLESWISSWFEGRVAELEDHSASLYQDFLAQVEPILFQLALKTTGGNRSKAAELLGIHRATLREKLRQIEEAD